MSTLSNAVSHFDAMEYCDALHAMRFPDEWAQPPWIDFDEWRIVHRCWLTADELIERPHKRLAQKTKDNLLMSKLLQTKKKQRDSLRGKRKQVQHVIPSGQFQKAKKQEASFIRTERQFVPYSEETPETHSDANP